MKELIVDEKKLIILYTPKVASTTLKSVILHYLGHEDVERPHIHEEMIKRVGNYDGESVEKYKDYQVFVIIRDPYKRIVSGYLNRIVDNRKGFLNKNEGIDHIINFKRLVNHLKNHVIDLHFEPQTSGDGWIMYNKLQEQGNDIKIFDISEMKLLITTLANIFNKDPLINSRNVSAYEEFEEGAYLTHYEEHIEKKPNYISFYNLGLKRKVEELYKGDFEFAEKHGYHYKLVI